MGALKVTPARSIRREKNVGWLHPQVGRLNGEEEREKREEREEEEEEEGLNEGLKRRKKKRKWKRKEERKRKLRRKGFSEAKLRKNI